MRRQLLIALFIVLPRPGSAQQSTAPAQSSTQTQTAARQERTAGFLPAFGVTNEKHPAPLTRHQKFHLFYRSAFDPGEFVLVGLEAGIGQAQDSFPAYGQGAAGFGKRFGAAFSDQLTSGFFTNFAYPVLLKQDPRYYRMGEGPMKRRLGHCLAQEFVGHKDGGARSFNWPNVLGALTSGSISNAYYPSDDRGFGLTMQNAGISLLFGSLGGIGNEFWPDIARKLHHKKSSVARDQTQK